MHNHAVDIVPRGFLLAPLHKREEESKEAREAELKIFFRQHDRNGDGFLDKNELKAAFRKLGAYFPGLRTFLSVLSVDSNKDGRVDISDDEMEKLVEYAVACGYHVGEVRRFRS